MKWKYNLKFQTKTRYFKWKNSYSKTQKQKNISRKQKTTKYKTSKDVMDFKQIINTLIMKIKSDSNNVFWSQH